MVTSTWQYFIQRYGHHIDFPTQNPIRRERYPTNKLQKEKVKEFSSLWIFARFSFLLKLPHNFLVHLFQQGGILFFQILFVFRSFFIETNEFSSGIDIKKIFLTYFVK